MPTLNAVLTDWNQNAYVSRAYADAYFTSHVEAQRWSDLDNAVKDGVLIMASTLLDETPTFAPGNKLYPDAPYEQGLRLPAALRFPNWSHNVIQGTADSGSTTTIVDDALADSDNYRDDFFIYGAVRITGGTNENSVRAVSDFAVATGTITVGVAFSAAIDDTSTYDLIYPLDAKFMNGVCEFALHLAANNAMDIDYVPLRIRNLLRDYFETSIYIR